MRKSTLALALIAATFAIVFMAWWLWPQGPGPSPMTPAEPVTPAKTTPAVVTVTPTATPAHLGKPPSEDNVRSGNESKLLSPEQFAALTEQTLRELPTADDLRGLSEEETHDYPEPLARAGEPLGRIAQAVHDQPSLKPQAAHFYSDCTKSDAIVVPVRALCYSHILGDPQAPLPESLPSEVVRLAKLIPAQ